MRQITVCVDLCLLMWISKCLCTLVRFHLYLSLSINIACALQGYVDA